MTCICFLEEDIFSFYWLHITHVSAIHYSHMYMRSPAVLASCFNVHTQINPAASTVTAGAFNSQFLDFYCEQLVKTNY
jgi:hypothetical protein